MSAETVDDCCKSYLHKVLPADASLTQRIETRRAFYAGTWTALQLVLSISEDEREAEAQLRAWLQECEAFNAQVKTRRAWAMSRTPWVVLRYDVQPPQLECQRCGSRQELTLPAHRHCKERKAE